MTCEAPDTGALADLFGSFRLSLRQRSQTETTIELLSSTYPSFSSSTLRCEYSQCRLLSGADCSTFLSGFNNCLQCNAFVCSVRRNEELRLFSANQTMAVAVGGEWVGAVSELEEVSSDVKLEQMSSDIELEEVSSDVELEETSNDIELEEMSSDVELEQTLNRVKLEQPSNDTIINTKHTPTESIAKTHHTPTTNSGLPYYQTSPALSPMLFFLSSPQTPQPSIFGCHADGSCVWLHVGERAPSDVEPGLSPATSMLRRRLHDASGQLGEVGSEIHADN